MEQLRAEKAQEAAQHKEEMKRERQRAAQEVQERERSLSAQSLSLQQVLPSAQ